ncbi:MAG: protein kinase [Euzebyales bacterium]|nr:protein kinase [Euzebyales bacterium]
MTDPGDQTETLAGALTGRPGTTAASDGPQLLGGRYVLTERVASGGMATVWKAHDEVLARTVAVKVLHDHLAADDAFRERFRREAIAAAKLTHPHVVGLYDTGTDGTCVYLVMEYVEGVTLKDVIVDRGHLENGQAASMGEKVARALDYAHAHGLVHRDVKPANILIGNDGSVKVADFGIAKAEEAGGDLTKTGMVLGTAAYVAPEQITGSHRIDGRADQYALGCVLYEALTGRQPFRGDSALVTAAKRLETDPMPVRSVRPDVPRGLDAVIMRALAREPADRYPRTGQMADALGAFGDANTAQTAALADTAGTTQVWTRPEPASPAPRNGQVTSRQRREGAVAAQGRRQGRWLSAVVALILLAGAAVGWGLATGWLDRLQLPAVLNPSGGGGSGDGGRGNGARPGDAERLEVADVASFDPPTPSGVRQGGDGRENDGTLPALTDGDASTTWSTETYSTNDFGGLKNGVGFVLDLGAPQRVSAVELQATTPGVSYELYSGDEPAPRLGGWERLDAAGGGGEHSEVTLGEPLETRYLLVWIVSPLPDGGAAAFSEATVLGTSG